MGIYFSAEFVRSWKEAPSWSYGNFNKFRQRLAAEIGIDLSEMAGFGGHCHWKDVDPIETFLNHSDCDGELSAEECETVAPRLRELIAKWNEHDVDRQRAELLAGLMDRCHAEQTPLIFC